MSTRSTIAKGAVAAVAGVATLAAAAVAPLLLGPVAAALPLGRPALRVRRRTGVGRVKVLGEPLGGLALARGGLLGGGGKNQKTILVLSFC